MLSFGKASVYKKITLHYVVDELEKYVNSFLWKPHKNRCLELSYACKILIKESNFHTVILLLYNELSYLHKGYFSLRDIGQFTGSKKLQAHLFQNSSSLYEVHYIEKIKTSPEKNFFNSIYSKLLLKIITNISGSCPFEKFIATHEKTPLQCFLPEEIGYFKSLLEALKFNDCDDKVFYCALQCSYNLFLIRNYILSDALKKGKIKEKSATTTGYVTLEKIYQYIAQTLIRRYSHEELKTQINLLSTKKIDQTKIIFLLQDYNNGNYFKDLQNHLKMFVSALEKK